MSQICIRRTKEMQDSQGNPLIPLPPVRQEFRFDPLVVLFTCSTRLKQLEFL